ncbi:MAG: acyl-CoA dehydrogenase family protein [Nocardioidaceae bacterium]
MVLRLDPVADPGLFDLTPTEDQQQLVDVVAELARERLRPAAAGADDTCATPRELLEAGDALGLAGLGVPEQLGGVGEHRSSVTAVLVAEALAHGDMGLAVALLARAAVATALAAWGDETQQRLLPALSGSGAPVAALALAEPTVLFDALRPATTAVRRGDRLVLDGAKSLVPRGTEAGLLLVGAMLDERPVLVLVDAPTPGLSAEPEPAMGLRAAGLSRVALDGVEVPADAVLGGDDAPAVYVECLRRSRLAWCALAVGTGQAVLDHVTPYVKQRHAFGAPIAHRQAVAFAVADLATEIQAMRLLTRRAAGRLDLGLDTAREIALARQACADHGMRAGSTGVQLLGGHGFVKEHPVERFFRDLRAVGLMEGGVLV